jgi:hypothetical protein
MMCATLFLVLEPAEIRCKNTIFQPTNQIFIFILLPLPLFMWFLYGKRRENSHGCCRYILSQEPITNKKPLPLALKASGSGTVLES